MAYFVWPEVQTELLWAGEVQAGPEKLLEQQSSIPLVFPWKV